jgi:hypothetical protein
MPEHVRTRTSTSRSVCVALSLALLALVACEKELTPEQKRQEAMESVGTEASIAAAIYVSAAKTCLDVGVPAIEQCAKLKGTLLAEQSAQIKAKLSLDQTASYWKSCLSAFPREYCEQLFQRAVAIEYRTAKPSQ